MRCIGALADRTLGVGRWDETVQFFAYRNKALNGKSKSFRQKFKDKEGFQCLKLEQLKKRVGLDWRSEKNRPHLSAGLSAEVNSRQHNDKPRILAQNLTREQGETKLIGG